MINFDHILETKPVSEKEYWENIAKGRELKPLNKPCKDCAVTTGFYKPYADKLKMQPASTQEKVLKTWFCHNNCNRSCAGIREFINTK